MLIFQILLCLIVVSCTEHLFTSAQTRHCADCIPIKSCKSALYFVHMIYRFNGSTIDDKRQFMRNSICGYDADNIAKVCCPDFPSVGTPVSEGITEQVVTEVSPSADPIDRHRNVGLLPSSCGDIDGARILNGEFAKLYEFPWMALITHNTSYARSEFACAGTIINSRYILTAAHCVINKGKKKKLAGVRIGELDYSTKIDCQGHVFNMTCETKIQDIEVEEVIPHENFTGSLTSSDIALLRLSEPVIMYNNAAPICLPVYSELREINLEGLNGTVAGWGTTENPIRTTLLRKVQIPIKSAETCSSNYNKNDRNLSFCADGDSCIGDGGAPFMIESEFNGLTRQVQYGIMSYGMKYSCRNSLVYYTDVSKYMLWILDHIKE
ncbi:phenoloxidase-activating factor 1-like isoform X2 [Bicyclus anynana]|uniref:CLIP domain-containing serine protease n=1 Tax=Bicyclus anynana TaxID=110368 RepID=A0ABM3LTJ6_BICAN|nr:phenoloxidase-activating factor 1-like isoform X2 [Bicyclus anynana]